MCSRLFGWAVVICFTACGCGGSSYKSPADVYPVSGTVTYNGKPVEGATVTFFATEAERTASGMTNAAGVYQLTTFTSNDGAVAGKQAVAVSKGGEMQPPPPDDQSPDYDPKAVLRSQPTVKPPIPVKYSDRVTSGLEATVTPDSTNQFDFDLKD